MSGGRVAPALVDVWPAWQRVLHWALAASVITALVVHEGGPWHEAAGWLALGLAAVRTLLGFIGPPAARFSAFLRGPRETLAYAQQLRSGHAPRLLNHNPLGAVMVVVLLGMVLLAGASGWLYTTDRFWGEGWVILLHACCTWPLVGLAALHVGGVWHASRAHGENLVAAMWHGRKRAE